MLDKSEIYLFANWKMYLDYDESSILADALANEAKDFSSKVKITVFPSSLSLYAVGRTLRDAGIAVGAQNVHWVEKGGYTGEVSALMYKDAGCEYALVGHSERRHLFKETNHEIRQKFEACLVANLTPVLCVGETLEEKKEGKTADAVEVQLRAAFQNIVWPENKEMFIAYEPVWAIGTGEACDPTEADRIHKVIQKLIFGLVPGVSPKILYGGSVRPENVLEYLNHPNIYGVLAGGASAKLDSWLRIIKSIK